MFQSSDADLMSGSLKADRAEPAGRTSVEGRIEKIRLVDDPKLAYRYFRSARPRTDLPLFVAVHGIQRRAVDQARMFAPLIDAIGGTMVAPLFARRHFKGYQRLGSSRNAVRSDIAFQRILSDIYRIEGRHFNQMVMFGYSGGGQFVHRYAMAYPRQVKRMAIAAAGWFTFPDLNAKFPIGLKRTAALPDLRFDAARFLKIPAMVLVGREDIHRDRALNQSDRIDRKQGHNRLARARKWVDTMAAAASRYGYATPYRFVTVPRCGHSFVECMTRGKMGRQVVRFLFDEERHASKPAGAIAIYPSDVPFAKGGNR